ncbi:MAG TPA: Cache 3/Cache 2 fusion domain-containing protein [Deltaproteobacteria bacterium]|nr:Cache 3/Cache 2 fusion domain-containing protein [Deltaproteobacteria bacterium]
MLEHFQKLRLNVKIALLGVGGVLFAAVALLGLAVWQSGQYNRLAQNEVEQLISADLDHITEGVYNLVRTENEAFQQQVSYNLKIARYMLKNAGGISFSPETVRWNAVNQLSLQAVDVRLPKMMVGNRWLGQNSSISVPTPLVDDISSLVSETTTVFQRMNRQGDMLRVATTVVGKNGRRAIGTYIPAIAPDGTKNPVIEMVTRGETYHGRAFVVNDWYLTAYEPIRDATGEIVGMLYGGVPQKYVEARLRQAILQTRVGKTGYVYVLSGKGIDRGRYIVSHRGERDGQTIWEERDGSGRPIVQDIIARALSLKPGELGTEHYLWKNPGENDYRLKVARIAYYEPWDWVIGVGTYQDELQMYRTVLSEGRYRMISTMGLAGVGITLLIGLIGVWVAWTIVRPVRLMTIGVERIIGGDLEQRIPVQSHDEIGILADAFNQMAGRLKDTISGLRESEAKYRSIYENSAEGIFQTSIDGRFLNVNPALASMLGYDSPTDLINSVKDLKKDFYVNPDDRDRFLSILMRHGTVNAFEAQCYCRDRQVIWLSYSARLQRTSDGAPLLIEGFGVNIDQRKKLEQALNHSRNYLEKIINTIADPIFVKDSQFRWVMLNDAYCNFMGYAREELLGRFDYDFFPKEEADVFREKDLQVFASGDETFNEEFFTDRSGTHHVILTKKSLYVDEQGERFIVGIITEITEMKRLEEQLRQSQKMETIGLLAGGISHDFNNLLTPILGYTELLMPVFPEGDPNREKLAQILHAAERARDLTRQLLAFSRKQVMELKTIDVGEAILRFEKMLRSTIRESIEIEIHIAPDVCPVRADIGQIEQVLLNLAVNAQDAMPEGGRLTVDVQTVLLDQYGTAGKLELAPGAYVKISVSDTGKGMDHELMEHIFEPFFTTKELGKGTGLGLSMVYGIAKQHGGAVNVYSELDRGSIFVVYLPCLMLDGGQQDEPVTDHDSVRHGCETILVVEDNEMVRMLASEMLKGLGYKVLVAETPEVGIKLAREHDGDICMLLSDVVMPNMNGMEMYNILKKDHPGLKILFMSGYTSEVIAHHGILEKGLNFIQKPFSLADISRKIRQVLDS